MFCDAMGSVFVWVVERATRPASKAMVFRSKDDDSMLEEWHDFVGADGRAKTLQEREF